MITQQGYIGQLVRLFEADGVLPVPIFINGIEAHTVVRACACKMCCLPAQAVFLCWDDGQDNTSNHTIDNFVMAPSRWPLLHSVSTCTWSAVAGAGSCSLPSV